MNDSRGSSLLDTLVTVAIIASALAVTLPALDGSRRQGSLARLARQVMADTHFCRAAALGRQRNVGLIFAQEAGGWTYTAVADGDWDGVSRRDYLAGADRALKRTVHLDVLCRGAGLGVPAGWRVPDPSGHGTLREGDGLRAGSAAIISFTPLGDATPASLYFNDGRSGMLVVRIYGGTARVRALEWRHGWPAWRRVPM
jgi:type II secretory pathway pseudopilin PulG